METLQNRFTGFGKLLHRIQNLNPFIETQISNQLFVGFFMDARLEAAKVNRDAVWGAMVQGFYDSLT